MDTLRIGFEPDLVARLEGMAFAKCSDDVDTAEFCNNLNFGTGWLDDLDHGLSPVIGNREMFRANTVDSTAPITSDRRSDKRKSRSGRAFKFRCAIGANDAGKEVHGGRADEPGD